MILQRDIPFCALVEQGTPKAAAAAGVKVVVAANRPDGATALAKAESFITRDADFVIEFQTDAQFGATIMQSSTRRNRRSSGIERSRKVHADEDTGRSSCPRRRHCSGRGPERGAWIAAGFARRGIVLLLQEISVLPDLSVSENICITGASSGLIERIGQQAKAAQTVWELGFAISPKARLADRSIAERRIVEIARALASEAPRPSISRII